MTINIYLVLSILYNLSRFYSFTYIYYYLYRICDKKRKINKEHKNKIVYEPNIIMAYIYFILSLIIFNCFTIKILILALSSLGLGFLLLVDKYTNQLTMITKSYNKYQIVRFSWKIFSTIFTLIYALTGSTNNAIGDWICNKIQTIRKMYNIMESSDLTKSDYKNIDNELFKSKTINKEKSNISDYVIDTNKLIKTKTNKIKPVEKISNIIGISKINEESESKSESGSDSSKNSKSNSNSSSSFNVGSGSGSGSNSTCTSLTTSSKSNKKSKKQEKKTNKLEKKYNTNLNKKLSLSKNKLVQPTQLAQSSQSTQSTQSTQLNLNQLNKENQIKMENSKNKINNTLSEIELFDLINGMINETNEICETTEDNQIIKSEMTNKTNDYIRKVQNINRIFNNDNQITSDIDDIKITE